MNPATDVEQVTSPSASFAQLNETVASDQSIDTSIMGESLDQHEHDNHTKTRNQEKQIQHGETPYNVDAMDMEVPPHPHGQDLDFQETISDASLNEMISRSGEDNEESTRLFSLVTTIAVALVLQLIPSY